MAQLHVSPARSATSSFKLPHPTRLNHLTHSHTRPHLTRHSNSPHVAMALTSAVANAAAAAAAAGAGKKAAQVQLQAELTNDDEWKKFISRDGLLVIDVYSEWCGPCIGMVGNLKKIKVEIGGDNLHLAVAKSDTIECLKRFRKRSEPTWMFIAGGQLLTVVFGADAPRIAKTIEEELHNEELAKKGELKRPERAPHELTPPEQELATAQEKIQAERETRSAEAVAAAREARREERAKRIETHFVDICPALMMPHSQKHLRKVSDALEPYGVLVADKCPILLDKDGARILGVEDPEFAEDAVVSALVERPSLSLLLKRMPEKEGNIIELSRRAIFGDGLEDEERPKKLPADELRADNLPGIFMPADRHQRAAALDLLFPKMVASFVEPPVPPQPPHIAMMFGAWQRRAVLAAAPPARLLLYGFYADASVAEPKLLCKTVDQYDARTEKDYCETIVLSIAVGAADPALADPATIPPPTPPPALLALGPLHVSPDSVDGEAECVRFFPPGYSEPEKKPKAKGKKRKKSKRQENKEETGDTETAPVEQQSTDQEETNEGENGAEGDGENGDDENGDSDEEGNSDENGVNGVDKATSPPPQTPH